MTFTNLIIILCCFVVMSYSIKIIVNSYNPKAAVYVNMYSIYYIFLLSTLLFASACNSYIETMSAGSSSGVPSTKSPNNSLVENGVTLTANSKSPENTSPDTNQANAETEANKLVVEANENLQDDVAEANVLTSQSDAITQSNTIISPDNTLSFKTNVDEAQTKVTEAETALKDAQAKVTEAQKSLEEAQTKVTDAETTLQTASEETKAAQTEALEEAQAAQAAAQKSLEEEEQKLTNVVVEQASKIQMNPESEAGKKLAKEIQQMQNAIEQKSSNADIKTLRTQLIEAVEAVEAEKKEPESNPQDEFTKAFNKVVETNKAEKEAQEVFLAAQEALKNAQGKTQHIITPILKTFSEAFHAAEKAAENNYNANEELNNLIKTKIEEPPKQETSKEILEQLKQKNDRAFQIMTDKDKF
jgi:chromosome segregation ATPase